MRAITFKFGIASNTDLLNSNAARTIAPSAAAKSCGVGFSIYVKPEPRIGATISAAIGPKPTISGFELVLIILRSPPWFHLQL